MLNTVKMDFINLLCVHKQINVFYFKIVFCNTGVTMFWGLKTVYFTQIPAYTKSLSFLSLYVTKAEYVSM